MAIDFPNSPVNGQEFTSGATTWVFSSAKSTWMLKPSGEPAYSSAAGNLFLNQNYV